MKVYKNYFTVLVIFHPHRLRHFVFLYFALTNSPWVSEDANQVS